MQGAAQEFDGWLVYHPAKKPVISQEQQTVCFQAINANMMHLNSL